MVICVECGKPSRNVVKVFGSQNIRLTRCNSCKQTCDKYVEFELILIFLDLLLHKIQVYRHLIFNRLPFSDTGIPRALWKFLFVLLVLDTYKAILVDPSDPRSRLKYSAFREEGFSLDMIHEDLNLFVFHSLTFIMSVLAFSLYVAIIILLVTIQLNVNNRCGEQTKYNYVVVAIILSSFGRGVLLFMLVWDYPVLFIRGVDVFVLTSNVVALKAFLDDTTSYFSCFMMVLPAQLAKMWFHDAARLYITENF
jgi:lipid intermediate transporter